MQLRISCTSAAFAHDQTNQRRNARIVLQNQNEVAAFDKRLRNSGLLSQSGEHGVGKSAARDLSALASAARAQLGRDCRQQAACLGE